MLPNIDYSELPRALQHMLERGQTVKTLPRRSFLKLAGTTGLALGAFPHIAMGDPADGTDRVGAAVHAAWVKHDVAQCGYCQSGQIMSAIAFLQSQPPGRPPTTAEIDAAMAGNICRCGTYARIRAAIGDAAKSLA